MLSYDARTALWKRYQPSFESEVKKAFATVKIILSALFAWSLSKKIYRYNIQAPITAIEVFISEFNWETWELEQLRRQRQRKRHSQN